jgi:hypothetical protein
MTATDKDMQAAEMLLAELESSPDEEVVAPSELKEAIHEMNRDDDEANGFSSIDMRTILHPQEVRSLIVIDMLTHMSVLPKMCGAISRKFKRLKVSEEGKGREQNVAVINGVQEQKAGISKMKALGNYIGLGGGK